MVFVERVYMGEGKPENSEKNNTQGARTRRYNKLNLHESQVKRGGKRVFSPLIYSCSPNMDNKRGK